MEERRDGNTGITRIAVKGFKSLAREVPVDLASLTILAGANSSGKSSLLQPFLLIKQTLEASYDPGSLLLTGPNATFTSAAQLLSRVGSQRAEALDISIFSSEDSARLVFKKSEHSGFEIEVVEYHLENKHVTLRSDMSSAAIRAALPQNYRDLDSTIIKLERSPDIEWTVARDRCFLALQLRRRGKQPPVFTLFSSLFPFTMATLAAWFTDIIHLPGLRGIPARTYPVTAVEAQFPGTFQAYTASVISHWQRDNKEKLTMVGRDLERLGLAWRVLATQISDTEVEVKVSRLPRRSASAVENDHISIADVGLGLSQVLPLVVALHAASPGQLVYLEQPEIHLHPRAQREFANVLVDAVGRGVRIVAETHSSLLLLGIQIAVAEGRLDPKNVGLHWFQRDEEGITSVRSGSLDASGAFGDWPEDFADVELESESRYLDAADHLRSKVH